LVVAIATSLGCGFDSGGVGTSTDASSSGGTSLSASTGDTHATAMPATTQTPGDTSSGPASTGAATGSESTGSADTQAITSSDTSGVPDTSTAADGTGEPDASYGPCARGCLGDDACVQWWNEMYEACGTPCEDDDECPLPPSGTAVPVCSPIVFDCVLSCSDDLECPEGMVCFVSEAGADRCAWESAQ
jgi:hypothetical protein